MKDKHQEGDYVILSDGLNGRIVEKVGFNSYKIKGSNGEEIIYRENDIIENTSKDNRGSDLSKLDKKQINFLLDIGVLTFTPNQHYEVIKNDKSLNPKSMFGDTLYFKSEKIAHLYVDCYHKKERKDIEIKKRELI